MKIRSVSVVGGHAIVETDGMDASIVVMEGQRVTLRDQHNGQVLIETLFYESPSGYEKVLAVQATPSGGA